MKYKLLIVVDTILAGKIKVAFLACLLLLCFFYSFSSTIKAFSEIIQEDFNDDNFSDGVPLKWIEYSNSQNSCLIENGRLVCSVPSNGSYTYFVTENVNLENYDVEVDVENLEGVDNFILFRYDPNREEPSGYYFKYRTSRNGSFGDMELGKGSFGPLTDIKPFSTLANQVIRFRIELNNDLIEIFDITDQNNEVKLISYKDESNPILKGGVGFFQQPPGDSSPMNSTAFDNLKLTIRRGEDQNNILEIKQFDENWKNDIYDHLSKLEYGENTIERWGCGLSAISMLLRYHNHNVFPGTPPSDQNNAIDLNYWLKNEKDGYLDNGFINWIAVTRFSRINKSVIDSSISTSILDFNITDVNGNNINFDPNNPLIIKFNDHFVYAKVNSDETITISDPGRPDNPTLPEAINYYSDIKKAYYFTPTHTDLSHLVITSQKYHFSIIGPNNEIYSSEYDGFLDNHIYIKYLKRPSLGTYKVFSKNNSKDTLKLFLYDKDGNLYNGKIIEVKLPHKNYLEVFINTENKTYRTSVHQGTPIDHLQQLNNYLYKSKIIFKSQYFYIYNNLKIYQIISFFNIKASIQIINNLINTLLSWNLYQKSAYIDLLIKTLSLLQ